MVDEYIDGLFSKEAHERPSDTKQVDEFELPKWFDEKLFNKGRRFFWDFCFTLSATMMTGLVATLSVPSINRVLVNTYRSTTAYTAYKRYVSTYLHTLSWFEEELKPGSRSWKSLMTVRNRHFRAGQASKLKGVGGVSQRDLAITMFGFIGFSVVHPDRHKVTQLRDGDWEGYNHFWRTIGYMIGIEDRFNLCRKNIEETRLACQAVESRVFAPCLENVPEYYEHMARSLLEGLTPMVPFLNLEAALFYTRYSAGVPGYIYQESDRIELQRNIAKQLKGKPLDTGVDTALLMAPSAVEGLPARPPRLLYYHDYDRIEYSPPYKNMSSYGKFRLDSTIFLVQLYSTTIGRYCFNMLFRINYFFIRYFPYNAFTSFGFKKSFVDMFKDSPIDNTQPKLNAEYYKQDRDRVDVPWYLSWIPKQYLKYFSYFINYRE